MIYDELFDGRYRIIKTLGRGGMGTVYLAENIKLNTFWAIKEIGKNSKVDILVEPNILKKLNHSALPRIFDILENENSIYIIEDYIEGTPLDVELRRVGRFSEEKVVNWAIQICDVLVYLHSQKPNPIIYRDMKPSNIILSDDGTIKLIDFGIAREYKNEADNDTVYIGTRGYAAPEQYGGTGQTSVRSDIYSLGVTLYHLLTGKSPNEPPYEIKPVRLTDSSLSKGIEYIIGKCTRQDPDERYQSIPELLNDISRIYQIDTRIDRTAAFFTDKSLVPGRNPVTVSFKKLVLTALGNCEFACEAAYIISKLTDLKVILINLDFTASKLDLYLNLVPELDKYLTARNLNFGFNLIKDAQERNCFGSDTLKKACIFNRDAGNLYILTDNYDIDNYEKYKNIDFTSLIECAYKNFDITILVLNNSVNDSFSRVALERADYNIVSIPANLDDIRQYEAYFQFMKDKYGITMDKVKFVAFDYKKDINLPENMLKSFFGGKSFSGSVTHQPEREKFRNINSFYARVALEKHQNEYVNILAGFNILPKKTLGSKIGSWLGGIFKKD
jgi:serine/threonine protein kinase